MWSVTVDPVLFSEGVSKHPLVFLTQIRLVGKIAIAIQKGKTIELLSEDRDILIVICRNLFKMDRPIPIHVGFGAIPDLKSRHTLLDRDWIDIVCLLRALVVEEASHFDLTVVVEADLEKSGCNIYV